MQEQETEAAKAGRGKGNFFAVVGVPLVGMFLPYAFLEFLARYLLRYEIALYEEPSFTLAYLLAKLPLLVPIALAQGVASYFLHRSSRDAPPVRGPRYPDPRRPPLCFAHLDLRGAGAQPPLRSRPPDRPVAALRGARGDGHPPFLEHAHGIQG